jgi:hypothetical protein
MTGESGVVFLCSNGHFERLQVFDAVIFPVLPTRHEVGAVRGRSFPFGVVTILALQIIHDVE